MFTIGRIETGFIVLAIIGGLIIFARLIVVASRKYEIWKDEREEKESYNPD